MDLKGYCIIKTGAQAHHHMGALSDFYDVPLRVMDWAVGGGALVVNAAGNAMADFPQEAIARSFRCTEHGDVLCPPELKPVERTLYALRCLSRKGGYNRMLRNMVVAASLHKGEFTDHLLWQVERSEGVPMPSAN